MLIKYIFSVVLSFSLLITGCTSREEEQANFEKTARNLRESREFVTAVREASAKTGIEEEILYGLTVIEGEHRDTYLDLTNFRRVGRLGLFRYTEDDNPDDSKLTLSNVYLAAANDLKHSYEVLHHWDLALLAWGSDNLEHVSLCLSDFPGGDLEQFIHDHLGRWQRGPCSASQSYENFEAGKLRTWATQYSLNNVRQLGTVVKSRIDIKYPR